jgi:homoserine kinase
MNAVGINPIEMEQAVTQRSVPHNFEIKVPASIANLGPGFDTLAVAVRLYLSLRVRTLPGHGQLEFRFIDHELRGENCIERAYRSLAGDDFRWLPSLSIEVRSEIPMRAGLGSSAAATVAGLRLYEAVTGPLPMQTLLSAACALESHPDNATASLLGGLTLSCQLPDGLVEARRFSWPESLGFVVLTPDVSLTTGESRAVLPECLSRADVVFNLQRVALLLQSLQSGDFSLLKHAMRDRVHQPARRKVVPGLAQALELEHPDLLGVCLSGSGPSLVAIAERSHREIGELLASVYQHSGIGYRIRILQAHQELSEHLPMFRSGLLCC